MGLSDCWLDILLAIDPRKVGHERPRSAAALVKEKRHSEDAVALPKKSLAVIHLKF